MCEQKNRYCIVVDLDDTIVFENFLDDLPTENNRELWNDYHKKRDYYNPDQYTPIQEVIDIVKSYYVYKEFEPLLVFLTSREDTMNGKIRANCLRLIYKYFGDLISISHLGINGSHYLLMREENDYRPSNKVKEDLLNTYILNRYKPLVAFDDDESNVLMLRKKGFKVMKIYNNMIKQGCNNG